MRQVISGTTVTLFFISVLLSAFIFQTAKIEPETNMLSALSSSEEQVLALVNGLRAYDYDLELENIAFQHYAFRSGGSEGANETATWVKEQFESFGLEAWLEPFEFTNWTLLTAPALIIDGDGYQGTTIDQVVISSFQSTHYSWPTPESGVFADLVVLPLPPAADRSEIGVHPINQAEWNAINTTGKVVLVGREVRWDYGWQQIYVNKLSAQTPAAVLYTWWYDWMSFTPMMMSSAGGRPMGDFGPYYWDLGIPVGFVDYDDGLLIRSSEGSSDVSAYVSIESVIDYGIHYNVVGRIGGYESSEKMVIISGHYDTVMCGGFGDNGAGVAGVVELAKVFADSVQGNFYKPKYTLLFVAFASEELWLVGSINYVKQHKSEMPNITAVINMDCIGSDYFYATETKPGERFDLDEVVLKAAQDLGVDATLEAVGGSDHEAFCNPKWANDLYYHYWGLDAGISDAVPVVSSAGFLSYPILYSDNWSIGVPGWIHTSYDNSTSTGTFGWVEAEHLGNHIKIAALTVMRLTTTLLGDVNGDMTVDILDAVLLANAFGSRPGDSFWNPNADLYHDEEVDILDAIVLASQFREAWT